MSENDYQEAEKSNYKKDKKNFWVWTLIFIFVTMASIKITAGLICKGLDACEIRDFVGFFVFLLMAAFAFAGVVHNACLWGRRKYEGRPIKSDQLIENKLHKITRTLKQYDKIQTVEVIIFSINDFCIVDDLPLLDCNGNPMLEGDYFIKENGKFFKHVRH